MIAFSLTISQSQIAVTTRHNVTEQLRHNTRQPAIITFFVWLVQRTHGDTATRRRPHLSHSSNRTIAQPMTRVTTCPETDFVYDEGYNLDFIYFSIEENPIRQSGAGPTTSHLHPLQMFRHQLHDLLETLPRRVL